jgi:dolichyl-phosphate beta-glucosyltransferase
MIISSSNTKKVVLSTDELYYKDLKSQEMKKWASIFDMPTFKTSIIIPAYNESKRLPKMLQEVLEFVKTAGKTEIIIVNDGSKDNTVKVAQDAGIKALKTLKNIEFKIMDLKRNRGKGGAVTLGILVASGENILFADADGASKFDNYSKLEKALEQNQVAIGSRAQMVATDAVVKRSKLRNFLMYSFHTIIHIFGIKSINDTQCGFKAFTRNAAANIFSNLHVTGWIFDIEVLLLAEYMGFSIKEIPIEWQEVDGTKMNLARDSLIMLKDLILIRINYFLGLWKYKKRL